jgi:hypothetical protein
LIKFQQGHGNRKKDKLKRHVIQIWKLQIWKRNPNLEITNMENFNKDSRNQLRMETKYGNHRSEKLKQRFAKSIKNGIQI